MRRQGMAVAGAALLLAFAAVPAFAQETGASPAPIQSEPSAPPPAEAAPPLPPPPPPAQEHHAVPRGESAPHAARPDDSHRRGGSDDNDGRRERPRSGDENAAQRARARESHTTASETREPRGSNTTASEPREPREDEGQRRRAVPGSRDRGGRTPTGTAVPRGTVRERPAPRGGSYTYDPYYSSHSYYSRYYPYPYSYGSFGLGYFYYDPLWSMYSSYWYPSSAYGGYGGYGGAPGSYPPGAYQGFDIGAMRIKVEPRHAQVFVDGYYTGLVDEFDGLLQRLKLNAGPHRVEVRADRYHPLVLDVMIVPGETITYKGALQPAP